MEAQTDFDKNLSTNSDNPGQSNLPVPVSSASSLDSFLVGLPSDAALASLAEVPEEPSDDSGGNNPTSSTGALTMPMEDIVPASIQSLQPLSAGAAAAMTSQKTTRISSAGGLPKPLSSTTSPLMAVGTNIVLPGAPPANNTVPEFLFQLTKMLTDDNRDTIEWSNGTIEVHSPHRLEAQVLHRYFRHSKFASFQRQLNYFGFRKKSGKGKMAPCSYVNQAVTSDLGSLLLIKRKTPTSSSGGSSGTAGNNKDINGRGTKLKGKRKNSNADVASTTPTTSTPPAVNPILAGILQQQSATATTTTTTTGPATSLLPPSSATSDSQLALARSAVGKGIRYTYPKVCNPLEPVTVGSAVVATTTAAASNGLVAGGNGSSSLLLSQLESNYRSCIGSTTETTTAAAATTAATPSELIVDTDPTPLSEMQSSEPEFTGFLRPNSSLVDLAMIPTVEDTTATAEQKPSTSNTLQTGSNNEMDSSSRNDNSNVDVGLTFVDFPYPEVYPAAVMTEQPQQADATGANDGTT